jgi:hypothetical protein
VYEVLGIMGRKDDSDQDEFEIFEDESVKENAPLKMFFLANMIWLLRISETKSLLLMREAVTGLRPYFYDLEVFRAI